MLNCKQASFLASKKRDSKLTKTEVIALWSHLLMCRLCRRYVKSLDQLHKTFSVKDKMTENLPGLPASARKRITDMLKKMQQSSHDEK